MGVYVCMSEACRWMCHSGASKVIHGDVGERVSYLVVYTRLGVHNYGGT
jgi:hypothetical protein